MRRFFLIEGPLERVAISVMSEKVVGNRKALGRIAVAVWIGATGVALSAGVAGAATARSSIKDSTRDVPSITELRGRVPRASSWRSEPARRVVERAVGRELKRMERLNRLFVEAGERHGVDPRLIYSIAWQESRFKSYVTSKVGAEGLMQFMPATSRRFQINPWDDEQAIDGAARYLRILLDRFHGDMAAAVAAYNAGEASVEAYRGGYSVRLKNGKVINPRRIRTSDGLPPYTETRNYVKVVSATWRTNDWAREFGPAVAARLGAPRFVDVKAGNRSEVARDRRETMQLKVGGGVGETIIPGAADVSGQAAQSERNSAGTSRFYASLESAERQQDRAASVEAPESGRVEAGVQNVVQSPGVEPKQSYVDPFSGARFVQKGVSEEKKIAVSRDSVFMGGE